MILSHAAPAGQGVDSLMYVGDPDGLGAESLTPAQKLIPVAVAAMAGYLFADAIGDRKDKELLSAAFGIGAYLLL